MAHQCWEPFMWTVLNNLLSVFCNNYDTIFGHGNMNCLEVRAKLLKDWLASPYCLGIWDAVIIECENYLACVMVAIFLFYPMVKQEILSTTFVWIKILRLFIMYHLLLYILDILHFYSFKFTYIRCDNMCFFYRFITRGQFWPSGIVIACVCGSVCVCINHELVRTITHHPVKLGSPNLDQRCKTPWFGSLLFWGMIDLDLQGQI